MAIERNQSNRTARPLRNDSARAAKQCIIRSKRRVVAEKKISKRNQLLSQTAGQYRVRRFHQIP